jgi:ribosomal-protein-serine acetyltransferase
MKAGEKDLRVDGALALVPRHPSDASEMFALIDRHRDALQEWLTWIDANYTVADVRRYAQFAQSQFEQLFGFDYSIRHNGAIVGGIGLYHVDWASRHAEMGYWLAPPARGQNVVTRAAEAMTGHAFAALNLHRIEIRCVVENLKSRAVAERLRYEFEGTLRESYMLHGKFRDLALYAMTARRWPPQPGKPIEM